MTVRLAVVFGCLMGGMAVYSPAMAEHDHGMDHHAHEMKDYSAEFAAAQPARQIQVEQCWVRLMPAQVPSAGYFEIENQQDNPIELLAARTDSFTHTMLHQTYEEEGMTKMQETDGLQIAAGQRQSFEPGGYHVMFEQPTHSLQIGDEIDLELLFNDGQSVSTRCKLNPAKARTY